MEAITRDLSLHLRERAAELIKLKESGLKIVGYVPGGYVPDELVRSCGAIPIGLARGGDHEAVKATSTYLCRFMDSFAKAQLGYRLLEEDPFYQMVDLYVVPITDNHMAALATYWEYYTEVDVFHFGVPHLRTDYAFDYYFRNIGLLKDKLEQLTESKISDKRLKEGIKLYNKMRTLLRRLSYLRKEKATPITGRQFIELSHASYYADVAFFVDILERLWKELEKRKSSLRKPRIMLTGSTLAMGDYRIVDMVEANGGTIVFEEFSEGIRPYAHEVPIDDNPLLALADVAFRKRVPCAFARPATTERFNALINQAREFNADGIIWYNTMYRDEYNTEGFYFAELARNRGNISVLKIETDYDVAEAANTRTKIEAFIEMLKIKTGG
jgi:benzoyl-CoA reductase/2-hydroxyglutaryl-CoA dehydratase subunit BcrC/BadD/HgdB